jgi:methylated-DNA-protein-cysteine methyltransferase-like protein
MGQQRKTHPQKNNASRSVSSLKKIQPSGKTEASFFEQVYDIVRQIPRGRVTTYGAIAKALGSGLSARMVGWAMNHAHSDSSRIPEQRVVNRNGQLSGKAHFGTPTRMQELLEQDGVAVENDTVKEFRKIFWDPASDLTW